MAHGGSDQLVDVIPAGRVGLHELRASAALGDQFDGGRAALARLRAHVAHDDVGALGREPKRHRPAQARRRTGDRDRLCVQPAAHPLSLASRSSSSRKSGMPIGRSISSARCATTPAVRASRANPRTIAGSKPRSASAAPAAPAPLMGSALPGRSALRPHHRERPQVRAQHSRLARDRVHARRPRVLGLVDGVAEAGDAPPGRQPRGDGPSGGLAQVVVAVARRGGDDLAEEDGRVLDHAEEDRSGPEETRRHRPLQRLRRAGVGQPRRQHGRREPVVCERDQDGIEQRRLPGGRPAPLHEQERQLGEGHPPHQLAGQIVAADRDRLGGVAPMSVWSQSLMLSSRSRPRRLCARGRAGAWRCVRWACAAAPAPPPCSAAP